MIKRNSAVTVAIISALGLVLAAVIGAVLQPSWWRPEPRPRNNLVIAGTVVDQATNRSIGQATISITGRTETYFTEDNGNFHIELQGKFPENGRARIHVTKEGYRPYDETVSPPTEDLIVPLRRM
jgi:hypothetical protein